MNSLISHAIYSTLWYGMVTRNDLIADKCPAREREQVFIGKQKDDLDGAAVPTPYLQQYYYTNTTIQRHRCEHFVRALSFTEK